MGTMEWLFLICALVGGILLVFRLLLQFLGADHGHVDISVSHEVSSGDADSGLKIISLQSATSFLVIFGLVGLALKRVNGLRDGWALLWATLAGTVVMLLVSWAFAAMRKLQSSGTLNLQNAVGQEAIVYLRIPAGGTGKVQVPVQGRLEVMDAVAEAKEEIKTGERVRVTRVISETVLGVQKL